MRNFLQSIYDSIVSLCGDDDFNLDVWFVFLLSISVYWGFGLIYTLIDLTKFPHFLYKYKIQDNTQVTKSQIIPVLKQVIINQTVVSLPLGIIAHYLKQALNGKSPQEIPTLYRFINDWIVFVIAREFAFYYSHRLLHHNKIYKFIHKRHHEWQSPIAITAVYCHPFEHIVSNVLPVFIGPLIMESHRMTLWVWMVYVVLLTLNDHSGYHFPFFLSAEFHDFHHFKFTQNYGILGLLDWIHGTDGVFRKSVSFQRHRILTRFTPIKYIYPDSDKNK